jgi:general secretion pathway protein G
MQNEREGGFTLIELLIVIVVLGILAGIVVLGLGTFRSDATAAACKADTKQVQIASDAFIAKPTNLTQSAAADVDALVAAGLLKSAPATGAFTIAADGAVTRAPAC